MSTLWLASRWSQLVRFFNLWTYFLKLFDYIRIKERLVCMWTDSCTKSWAKSRAARSTVCCFIWSSTILESYWWPFHSRLYQVSNTSIQNPYSLSSQQEFYSIWLHFKLNISGGPSAIHYAPSTGQARCCLATTLWSAWPCSALTWHCKRNLPIMVSFYFFQKISKK